MVPLTCRGRPALLDPDVAACLPDSGAVTRARQSHIEGTKPAGLGHIPSSGSPPRNSTAGTCRDNVFLYVLPSIAHFKAMRFCFIIEGAKKKLNNLHELYFTFKRLCPLTRHQAGQVLQVHPTGALCQCPGGRSALQDEAPVCREAG